MIGRETPHARRRALIVIVALASCMALPGAALAAPPEPVYQHDLNDCVTGDNQFWSASDGKFHWWVNQTVGADGSNGPLKCDTYQNDQYERPTDQTFSQRAISRKPPYMAPANPADPPFLSGMAPDGELAVGQSAFATSGTYFEYGDITRGRAGTVDTSATEGWLFFQVELFGDATVSDSLDRTSEFAASTYYSVRLAGNADPNKANGGIMLRNQRNANITTSWSTTDAKVFADTNSDVSGAGGVNVTRNDGDAAGNGYNLDEGNQSWLWVRRRNVTFTGPGGTVTRPAIEFGFNYKKYNQDRGKNFTPANLSYVDLDATKGLQDAQNYLWNDKYTLSQAGSPNPGEIGNGDGTENVYQLDTLRMGGFPARLTVVKETAPANSGADQFDFTLTDKAPFKLDTDGDDGDGAKASETFAFTTFGNKTVTESLPAGWDLSGISCDGGSPQYGSNSATVNVQPGSNVTCTFTNTKRARVEIVKETQPAAFDRDFEFAASGQHAADLGASFTLNAGATASTGVKLVRPGAVTVSETVPAGWDLESVVCTGDQDSSGASGQAVLTLAAGDDVRCVFRNTKRGSVTVEKTEGGSSDLSRDWQFQLSGNGIQPITKSTAGGNPVVFGDLKPGTYTLCEIGMPAGWHSSLGADGCVEITIDPGEDEKLAVDNVRPDVELEKEVRRLPGGSFAKTALAHRGDTVQYRFRVTNAGVGELSVVLDELAPDRCDPGTLAFVGGDDGDGKLDEDEVWEYVCAHVVTAGDPDPLPNTAKATGTDKFGNSDEDESSASVDVIRPDVEVDKKLRRGDAGDFVDGPITVQVGDTIQYRFEVTNAGDTPLAVDFSDPRCGAGSLTGPTGDADGDGKLDVTETWVYRCSHVVTAQSGDPVLNTVTVKGTDELGGKDEDTDSARADVVQIGIAVDKKLRRGDSGEFVEGPIKVHVGDSIQYRFEVTNTGEAPLAVDFSDPRCDAGSLTGPTGDADNDGKLDVSEMWVYRCSHVVTAQSGDPVLNTVTVKGTDELGGKDEDTDSARADVVKIGIEVDKKLRRGDSGEFVEGPIKVHVGDTIQYGFEVTNTGDAPLAVQFSDPRCDAGTLAFTGGDGDNDGKLDVSETWVYRCSHVVAAQSGDPVLNTVTVKGTDEFGGEDTDTDDESADVLHPNIEIDKQVDKQTVHVGDTLNYTFVVTNAGDTPLAVEFSDPRCDAGTLTGPTGDADGDGKLDVTETWSYKCAHVVTDGDPNPLPNTAKVTGTDELGGKDSDEDSTSVTIIKPSTLVVKEGNVYAYPGDTVTFTFAVTNNGNTSLTDVVVTDDRCAPVTRVSGDASLDPGETWNYTCSKQIPAGHKIGDENPIRNVATATGKDQLGKTVTATDDHLVRVLHPAIDIEKTGPATAQVGAALQYTLTVTNPGDVPFARQDVVVTDPRCEAPPAGPSTGGDATPGQLDPGDTWIYTCTAQTAGQSPGTFVNTATVTARDFNGRAVSDTDEFPTLLEVQGVLPAPEVISGRARLRGPSGCVYGPFRATVRGRRIARVTFYRDGKKVKTIVARRGQRVFRVRINPGKSLGIHRVTARVRFRAASGTRARTLRLSYQRCRRQVVRPRFTG